MLLRENKKRERKEKEINNFKTIRSYTYNNNNNKNNILENKENTNHQFTLETNIVNTDCIDNKSINSNNSSNSSSSSSRQIENEIEVIPELQISELFLYWTSLPSTQNLIQNYLSKFGVNKHILNNLTTQYFNPYLRRLETSERKKNDLLDIQKFLFSINNYNNNTSKDSHCNSTYTNYPNNNLEIDTNTNTNINTNINTNTNTNTNISTNTTTDTDIDNSEISSFSKNCNTEKIKKENPIPLKPVQREKRKIRKLDSSRNTYINHLSTSIHNNNKYRHHQEIEKEIKEIEKEIKEEEKDNKCNNNNNNNKPELELTETITEIDTLSTSNKSTEKTMENNLLVEQTKNELNENLDSNETLNQEEEIYTKAKKYDSGVDISIDSKPAIPRFYFPKGRPLEKKAKQEIEEQLKKIELLFNTNGNQINEQEFWKITEECELPRYISAALFKKVAGEPDDISQINVSFENFKSVWTEIKSNNFDLDSLIFSILKPKDREKYRGREDYLLQEDFFVVINDVVQYHPGLEFLSNMPIFQNRYIETVISRLFYSKPRNWNERMTLNEFRKVKFTQKLINLQDEDDDININRDIFSYKHFYVIYCKFWELDKDHDMKINRNELAKYDQFSMTPIMIDRVIEGYGKVTSNNGEILKSGWRDKIDDQKLNSNQPKAENFTSLQEAFRKASIKNKNLILGNIIKDYNKRNDPNIMLYKDFIWFILSAEDKGTTQAIEYWFRCLDLDGDGVISVFEIEQFWIEQYQRMIEWRTVDIWSFNDFLCYLLDMIQPETKNMITLADLKRSKNTPLFFDMLFDIKKYDWSRRYNLWG